MPIPLYQTLDRKSRKPVVPLVDKVVGLKWFDMKTDDHLANGFQGNGLDNTN